MSAPANASQIQRHLFQGGAPPQGRELAARGFRALVLCAEEHQPPAEAFPGVRVFRAPNDDSGRAPTSRELVIARRAAAIVAELVRARQMTLVTCAMGLNRSGLVVALALRELTAYPGARCVEFVRRCRPGALSNTWFVHEIERADVARPLVHAVPPVGSRGGFPVPWPLPFEPSRPGRRL